MAADPTFSTTPIIGMAVISTANTVRDGTGAMGIIATGGANGTKVERVKYKAQGITVAGMIRLFIGDDAGTPNIRMIDELDVAAVAAPSATIKTAEGEKYYADLVLPSGYTLRAATHNGGTPPTETFNVFALGGSG